MSRPISHRSQFTEVRSNALERCGVARGVTATCQPQTDRHTKANLPKPKLKSPAGDYRPPYSSSGFAKMASQSRAPLIALGNPTSQFGDKPNAFLLAGWASVLEAARAVWLRFLKTPSPKSVSRTSSSISNTAAVGCRPIKPLTACPCRNATSTNLATAYCATASAASRPTGAPANNGSERSKNSKLRPPSSARLKRTPFKPVASPRPGKSSPSLASVPSAWASGSEKQARPWNRCCVLSGWIPFLLSLGEEARAAFTSESKEQF